MQTWRRRAILVDGGTVGRNLSIHARLHRLGEGHGIGHGRHSSRRRLMLSWQSTHRQIGLKIGKGAGTRCEVVEGLSER